MRTTELQSWVEEMQQLKEGDTPYTRVDGQLFTPNQILQAANSNPELWAKIQAVMGDPMYCPRCEYTTTDMSVQVCPRCGGQMHQVAMTMDTELLKERFRERVKEGRVLPVYRMRDGGCRRVTPEEQLREVEEGVSSEAESILLAERKLLEEMERRRTRR